MTFWLADVGQRPINERRSREKTYLAWQNRTNIRHLITHSRITSGTQGAASMSLLVACYIKIQNGQPTVTFAGLKNVSCYIRNIVTCILKIVTSRIIISGFHCSFVVEIMDSFQRFAKIGEDRWYKVL